MEIAPKKSAGRVISIDSLRTSADDQPHPPQPAQAKRKFQGNAPTAHSLVTMHGIWVAKVARFYRMEPRSVEQIVVEAIQQRRAA